MIEKYRNVGGIFFVLVLLCMGCAQKEATTEIRQAFVALEILEYEEALKIFEEIITSNLEEQRTIARGRGLSYLGLTRYEEAIASFQHALSYSNGIAQGIDYDINYYLALAYHKSGDYERAIEIYDTLIFLQPKESHAYYLKGVLLLEQGRLEDACRAFEGAIMCDVTDYNLLISVAKNFTEAGEETLAKSYLQEVFNQTNSQLDAATSGKIYYYLEDYNQARLHLDQVKGTTEEVTLMLGQTYEELGDLNYAIIVYEDYLKTNINSAIIYNRLALCFVSQERYSEALKTVQNALTIGENVMRQTLLYNEIVIYEYLGDFAQAAILMKSYLLKYPDDEKAIREYQFLETR